MSLEIQFWPKKSKYAYTCKEVVSWYTSAELDEDDEACRKAEKAGAKLRAYMEWLSRWKERVAEARILMGEEDDRSLMWRECVKKQTTDLYSDWIRTYISTYNTQSF